MISKWTGTDKEVVYIFLGPSGIMTMDPTIKARWCGRQGGREGSQGLNRMKSSTSTPGQ